MKVCILTTAILFAVNALAMNADHVDYRINDGHTLPGTFTEKLNTSVNPAPATVEELIESTTLTNRPVKKVGPYTREAMEAQEEGPLDYSTTPETRPKK